MREAAHFTRNHRKTSAFLAGTGCFNGGIQRQNIGLECNAIHYIDDVGNQIGTVGHTLHRFNRTSHHIQTFLYLCCGTSDHSIGLRQIGGIFLG